MGRSSCGKARDQLVIAARMHSLGSLVLRTNWPTERKELSNLVISNSQELSRRCVFATGSVHHKQQLLHRAKLLPKSSCMTIGGYPCLFPLPCFSTWQRLLALITLASQTNETGPRERGSFFSNFQDHQSPLHSISPNGSSSLTQLQFARQLWSKPPPIPNVDRCER